MRSATIGAILLTVLDVVPGLARAETLQNKIDETPAGGVLSLSPGVHAGPVTIRKSITLDGGDRATIDGGGTGTVLRIEADGVTVAGLRLRGSGALHSDTDACIYIRGDRNLVRDNILEDCLFGIDLDKSNDNIIRRNRIASKNLPLGIRGDSIRLWYSNRNRIQDNTIENSRDLIVSYAADNLLAGNTIRNGRYGAHFMFAGRNRVENNILEGNSVGIFLMYSDNILVHGNRISHGQGASSMGVGIKEGSSLVLRNNDIIYCATGVYIDVSPYEPDSVNTLAFNRIAYNSVGILFHNDWTGNILSDNSFLGNDTHVSVNARASAHRNVWDGNTWDDYQGFDHNGDGIGDTPHRLMVYADRIWMDVPPAAFFKGSPALVLLDLIERLAPFSEPLLLLTDSRPRITPRHPDAGEGISPQPTRIDPFGLGIRR